MQTFVLLISAALVAAACTSTPPVSSERPADFSLSYGWSTGSLPPQYQHAVQIQVMPDGSGTLRGSTAYGSGPSETWTFSLSSAEHDALYTRVREAGLFRNWAEDSNPPVGGSSWAAGAVADGQRADVPSFVVSRQSEAKDALKSALRSAAPLDVWTAHDAWLAGAQRTLADGDGG